MGQKRVIKPSDERRRELTDAARELFVEQGYEQTSMSDIARRANVAQGTFYIYFSSKQEVLAAIMRELLEELGGIVRELAERSDLSALEALRRVMHDCIARMTREPRLVEAVYLKANYSLPSRLLEEYAPALLPAVTALIERGVSEGTVRVKNPEIAADFLWTLGYRFFERIGQQYMGSNQASRTGPDLTELEHTFWEFVLHGIAVQPES